MKTESAPNLNTPAVRRVLQNIIWNVKGKKPKLADIKIKENDLFVFKNEPIFRGSRHHHYPEEENHLIGVYEWLKDAEIIIKHRAEEIEV